MLRQLASFGATRQRRTRNDGVEVDHYNAMDHAQPRALPAHLTFTIPTYGESHLGAWGASGL